MRKFLMETRRDKTRNEQPQKLFFDEIDINIYDSPDPRTTKHSEGEFYGAQRTLSLQVKWEDDHPVVLVNGADLKEHTSETDATADHEAAYLSTIRHLAGKLDTTQRDNDSLSATLDEASEQLQRLKEATNDLLTRAGLYETVKDIFED